MSSVQGGGSAIALSDWNEIINARDENRRHVVVPMDMILDNDNELEFLPILHLPSPLKESVIVNHREENI